MGRVEEAQVPLAFSHPHPYPLGSVSGHEDHTQSLPSFGRELGGGNTGWLQEDREPQVDWDEEFWKGMGGERLSDEVQTARLARSMAP